MIRTVIFDIGNVLADFDWKTYIHGMFSDDKTIQAVSEAIWKTKYWEEFDRGVLEFEEIVRMMEAHAPEYREEIRRTIDGAGACLHRFDYAIPWICMLKEQGYRVVFLSNYSEFLMEKNPGVLDFLPYMDGGLFSCHAKLIKPDRRIYEALCEKCGLIPEESLFIDDNAANIEAARAFGLHAIRFEGYEKSYDGIMQYLQDHKC